jgi:hypothetical protein
MKRKQNFESKLKFKKRKKKKFRGVNSSADARMKHKVWHMFCLWKMQEIHQGRCEECKQLQGVVFCNLFITINMKFDYVNHMTQLCEYFKSMNYMSALKLFYGAL